MFDLNWAELLIIGFVALIVIGPEDLPDMFRQLGRFTAKLRQMSREFSRAMEDAAKQSGMKDAADDLKAATSTKSLGLDAVREAANKFEKWDPIKNAAKPTAAMPARSLVPPPMPATPEVVINDADEAADDLAAHEGTAPAPAAPDGAKPDVAKPDVAALDVATLNGTMTPRPLAQDQGAQALYDKLALRSQVLQEQTEKLKQIEAGTYQPTAAPLGVNAAPAPVTLAPAAATPEYPVASEVTGPLPVKRSSRSKTVASAAEAGAGPKVKTVATAAEVSASPKVKTGRAKPGVAEAAASDLTATEGKKKKAARKMANKADEA